MLVFPLDDSWRGAIASVLAAQGWPSLEDTARLGPLVARLSESYNLTGTAGRDLLPARLAFSFPRDVPKGAAAVRELVGTGRLSLPADRPLRVLDLGAGLGAMTWGVARALEAAGHRGEVDATWVDADESALGIATAIARARGDRDRAGVGVRAHTVAGNKPPRGPAYDLVIVGQMLSELDRALAPEARIAKHAALTRALLDDAVTSAGSLVIVEPAPSCVIETRLAGLENPVNRAILPTSSGPATANVCTVQGGVLVARSIAQQSPKDVPVVPPLTSVPTFSTANIARQGHSAKECRSARP
jgi:hypothetical protein